MNLARRFWFFKERPIRRRTTHAVPVVGEAYDIYTKVYREVSLEGANALNHLAITIALTPVRIPEAITVYRRAFDMRQSVTEPSASGARHSDDAVAALPGAAGGGSSAVPTPSRRAEPGTLTLQAMLSQRGGMAEVEAAISDALRFAETAFGKDSWEEAFYQALRVGAAARKPFSRGGADRAALLGNKNKVATGGLEHASHSASARQCLGSPLRQFSGRFFTAVQRAAGVRLSAAEP